jgi:hypothetical protein
MDLCGPAPAGPGLSAFETLPVLGHFFTSSCNAWGSAMERTASLVISAFVVPLCRGSSTLNAANGAGQ